MKKHLYNQSSPKFPGVKHFCSIHSTIPCTTLRRGSWWISSFWSLNLSCTLMLASNWFVIEKWPLAGVVALQFTQQIMIRFQNGQETHYTQPACAYDCTSHAVLGSKYLVPQRGINYSHSTGDTHPCISKFLPCKSQQYTSIYTRALSVPMVG